jgi:hypothetical protein
MSRCSWHEVIYRCDGNDCSNEHTIPETKVREADKIMKEHGWLIEKSGICYCPECAIKEYLAQLNQPIEGVFKL